MEANRKLVYIRWMAAFAGRRFPLSQSIVFETQRKDSVACEKLSISDGKVKSTICPRVSTVGLLLKNSAIYRNFAYDCYSEVADDGGLRPTRRRREAPRPCSKYWHTESWAKMSKDSVQGVVVYGSWQDVPTSVREQIRKALRITGLDLYCLTYRGQFEKLS